MGGAAGTGSREDDAFLTTTRGEPGDTGESTLFEATDAVREREKITGEGDGVWEDVGEEEPLR